ncbi:MAG: right-handed parallel beta-helix repeat-containing protein, partial [Candidatus Hydrogenedentes bacterium]|nr:right-handed parallel beta-helix repeat-containing protein [Candidatus Hydrogenedentota bacterium]
MKSLCVGLVAALTCAAAVADVLRVPGDYDSVAAAAKAARPGDTVLIGPGTYPGPVAVPDGVNLKGKGPARCVLQGAEDGVALHIDGRSNISGLTIRGAETGAFLTAGASAEFVDCHILGNKTDGIGFDKAFDTYLFMQDCLVSGNGDGVDLESTQAVFLNTRFEANGDDGLDLDGDAGALIYGCTFCDNKDDGIEIRIATRTHAIVQGCRFERNGEDGVEVIDSPVEGGIYNIVCVQNSSFDANTRFGVGFVAQDSEVATEAFSKAAVYAAANAFANAGDADVSANYAEIFMADRAYPQTVKTTIACGEKLVTQEVAIQMPVLVGIYDLRPTTDGTEVDDAEAVTVVGDRVFVGDDNTRKVYVLNRRTSCVTRAIPTKPFTNSQYEASGPEGLDVIEQDGKQVLLLSDDEGPA